MPATSLRVAPSYVTVKRGLAGLGLFATAPIKKGAKVIEYWGDILSDDAADKKGGKYLFDIPDHPLTIDGTRRDNTARYINHSCKPNCEPVAEGKRIFIYALRTIKSGEELTYDYGKDYMEDEIKEGRCKCGNH